MLLLLLVALVSLLLFLFLLFPKIDAKVLSKLSKIKIKMKGVFVGSGSEGMQHPQVASIIIDLVKKKKSKTTTANLLYIGTPTYDLKQPQENQTARFKEAIDGVDVKIKALCLSSAEDYSLNKNNMKDMVLESDIILVSGGNTLYAIDRWHQTGLTPLLCEAAANGVVLCGGSAG